MRRSKVVGDILDEDAFVLESCVNFMLDTDESADS